MLSACRASPASRPGYWLTWLSAVVLVTVLSARPLHAAEPAQGWDFNLTPYAWLAGLRGDIAAAPNVPAAPIDVSPSDVIDDLEATLMLIFSARRDRHGVYTDLFYADIQSDQEVLPPPIDRSLRVGAETTLFTLAYQYEVMRSDAASIELLAGGRYWSVENRLRFTGGSGPLTGRQFRSEESWTDPLLGIKGMTSLGETRFYLVGGGAIGGFGAGSDFFYEVSGGVGYRWSPAIDTVLGYRRLEVDYGSGDFLYDVVQQGWQLGLTWHF